jgi:hypothetical protein
MVYLYKYAKSHEGSWYKFFNGIYRYINWAYKTSLHTVAGFAPYYLIFGREPRLPIYVWKDTSRILNMM